MRKVVKWILASLTATALLIALALPVAATVTESGYKTCSSNYTAYTRSYSTGDTTLYAPGEAGGRYYFNATWTARYAYASHSGGGGNWYVYVNNGSLDDPGTYAACAATGGS